MGEGIDQQGAHHAQDGYVHAASAQFHVRQYAHHRHGHHHRIPGDPGGHGDDLVGVGGIVEEGDGPDDHDNHIVPWDMVGPHVLFGDGIVEIADDQHQSQEQIQPLLGHHGAEHGDIDAVHREGRAQEADHQPGRALPDADVGLPVVFFHDAFHVLHGAGLHVGGQGLFVFRGHRALLSARRSYAKTGPHPERGGPVGSEGSRDQPMLMPLSAK